MRIKSKKKLKKRERKYLTPNWSSISVGLINMLLSYGKASKKEIS